MTERKKHEKNLKERGITLVALVVTIIVLLILAGVALATLIGDSGILNNAEKAIIETEISGIEEQGRLIYSEKLLEQHEETNKKISIEDIVGELRKKGYAIEKITSFDKNPTDIILNNSKFSVSIDGTIKIKVDYDGAIGLNTYYTIIKGKHYKIKESKNGIQIERTASKIQKGETLKAEVTSGNTVEIEDVNQNQITVKGKNTVGPSEITLKFGDIAKTCTTTVVISPTAESIPKSDVAFSTNYGTVDIIWLDGNTNTIAEKPNEPNLYTSLENKKLVPTTWTYVEGTNGEDGIWEEDDKAKDIWYNYKPGNGMDDNTLSMWANAKNTTDAGDSYFVWIPRYAYRITYYSDANYTNLTGFYDGWGMWKAEDGSVKYKLDEGIETVTHNGNKYIVHPAFIDDTNKTEKDEEGKIIRLADYDRGGWNKNLTGFWVAKYEMSRKDADIENEGEGFNTTFKSVPSVQSARNIINNVYTVSLAYDENKESHLMKNSEWGAVAYLTHSQYGRNGYEIDINNSSTCVTGNGGAGTSTEKADGVTKFYNTIAGAKASSTGNIYGIYDLSGGAVEFVAGYDKLGSKWSALDAQDKDGNYISTKYITAYSNGSSEYSEAITLYSVGKVGDATKEVRRLSASGNWFGDDSVYLCSFRPYFARGGAAKLNYPVDSGVFASHYFDANFNTYASFRIVLAE